MLRSWVGLAFDGFGWLGGMGTAMYTARQIVAL